MLRGKFVVIVRMAPTAIVSLDYEGLINVIVRLKSTLRLLGYANKGHHGRKDGDDTFFLLM